MKCHEFFTTGVVNGAKALYMCPLSISLGAPQPVLE